MSRPAYYEHSCGFYHPAGYNGGCDDESKNFIAEELDERYGPEGWEEIYMDEDPEPKGEFVVRRKNYDKMMALTPAMDIHDKPIEIGCRVRCFMPVYYDPGNDWLIGMNTTGKCCYVEGKLVNIEETKDGPYYAVEMEKEVAPIVDRSQNYFSIRNTDSLVRAARGTIKVPANGTPVKGIKVNEKGVFYRDAEALTWKTFGVVRI